MKGSIYLIPNTLGSNNPEWVLPAGVTETIRRLDHFIVENIRSARRFIISCGYEKSIDDIKFFEIGKHSDPGRIPSYLDPCLKGIDVGIISEAGVPGVADPGANITSLAHKKGIRVVPLTGPSSILLALMASGLNGQSFCFHGYLPVSNPERAKKIADLERMAIRFRQTQLFIETPYRNEKLFADILRTCKEQTQLCVACDLTMETEDIRTMTIGRWKKEKVALHKRPCIFLLGVG